MSTIYSVGYFANAYADKQVAGQNPNALNRQLDRDRAIYDFTVTGFNLSTAASIVAVAAAVIINSPLVLVLALLVCTVRQAFKEGAEQAALPNGNRDLLQNMSLEEARGHVVEKLNIQQENWNPVKVKLLNFRIWMNSTPAAPAPAQAGGAARAERIVVNEQADAPQGGRAVIANINPNINGELIDAAEFAAAQHARFNEPIGIEVVHNANRNGNHQAIGNNQNNNYNGGLEVQEIAE